MSEDGRTRRAEERRRKRRQQILDAARRVIGDKGYAATSIADVIGAAGISRGTFYLYFESREALFIELLESFLDRLTSAIEVIGRDDDSPAESMFENMQRVIDTLVSNPDLTRVLFREAVGINDEIDDRVDAFYQFLDRMVVGALRRGVERGLTREVDEAVVAPALIGSIKEVLYKKIVVLGERQLDAQTLTFSIFDFGFRGLQRREP